MHSKTSLLKKDYSGATWLRVGLPLLAWLFSGNAWGDVSDPKDPNIYFPCASRTVSYAAKAGQTNPHVNDEVSLKGTPPASVYWEGSASAPCSGADPNYKCFDNDTFEFTLPNTTDNPLPSTAVARLVINKDIPATVAAGDITVTVKDATNLSNQCTQTFHFKITSSGGGWGDPHITTVDGVNYDFQSAGEFVALRGKGMEIQTRQVPVATATVPAFTNPYTGLQNCVSLYSAVAARVGKHRVSYQPNISGEPDPSGMQLRVDGVLTTLGSEGIDLGAETAGPMGKSSISGRILKSSEGKGIEIQYADGTQLIVTPAYWDAQGKWYLNVAVNQTTATEGIMGQLAKGSWLPALPGGTSLGPKPESLHERYAALYETFANAWRVTDANSLFDYAPGTSTATFSKPGDWPRENPSSCVIEREPLAQPMALAVAEGHCAAIADPNRRANCVFDVAVTGHAGFAETYQLTEQAQPGATKTSVTDDKDPSKHGKPVTFTATVARVIPGNGGGAVSTGAVQFMINGAKAGEPIKLDVNGQALWTTSSLPAGTHTILAAYIPAQAGWGGERLMASNSAVERHEVVRRFSPVFWLFVLFIAALIWWLKHK